MANVFFVEYDLIASKNYAKLTSELTRLGGIKYLLSSWSVDMNAATTAENLCNHLKTFIDADDRLMVSKVVDWAGVRLLARPHNT